MANRFAFALHRALPRAASPRGRGHAAAPAILQIPVALFLSKEMLPHNALAFLAARAGIFGELHPFGAAFFLALLAGNDRKKAVGAGACACLGAATALPAGRAAAFACAVVLSLAAVRGAGAPRSPWRAIVTGGAFFGLARIAAAWPAGLTWHDGISALAELGFVLASAGLFLPAVPQRLFDGARRLDRQGFVGIGLLAAAAGLGLYPLGWGAVEAGEVWNRWVTLMAATVRAGAGGAAVGTAVGVLASLTGRPPLGGMGLFAAGGLFAGLFSSKGRPGVAAGFLLGELTVAVHAQTLEEVASGLLHTGVALVLLAAVPARWIARIARSMPGPGPHEARQLAKERRLREAIHERLAKVGGVFIELADVFSGSHLRVHRNLDPEADFRALVERVWERQCKGCPGFSSCWERNFYASYWDAVDLFALGERAGKVEAADLPGELAARCQRKSDFVGAVNAVLSEAGRVDPRTPVGAAEIVPQQLRGVAELIEEIAGQVSLDTGWSDELEAHLREELELSRIRVGEVRVVHAAAQPEVEVEYAGPCDGCGQCGAVLSEALERVFGHPYRASGECRRGREGVCRVLLVPEPPYELEVEVAHFARGAEEVSGDTYAQVELGGGKVALVLSDGMGVGTRAALESRATVGMLEKMIRAGFDRSFAAQTVNAVLLMRSPEEVFATVDLAVVDLFTGEVELLKVGSSPTFIKRRGEVEVIRSDSPPAGILNEIDVFSSARTLRSGDILVMMTDGILDALPDRHDKEEWIARILLRQENRDLSELVGLLVERAKQAAGGEVDDDVTVLAARLARRKAAGLLAYRPEAKE